MQGLTEADWVDSPVVVNLAVDEQDRDLFGIACEECVVVEDVLFGEGNRPFEIGEDVVDYRLSIVAEMAAWLADKGELNFGGHINILGVRLNL